MQRLKKIAVRSGVLTMAVGFFGAMGMSFLPRGLVFADALNPLTERSLTLSSSSPGWSYTDGSGNSTYAPPNSGANGKKSGHTFQFVTSSDGTIKAFSFQYCTKPAGYCQAPGDNEVVYGTAQTPTGNPTVTTVASQSTVSVSTDMSSILAVGDKITTDGGHTYTITSIDGAGTTLGITPAVAAGDDESAVTFTYQEASRPDTSSTSDLAVHLSTPTEITGTATTGDWNTILTRTGDMAGVPNPNDSEGNFIVLTGTDFDDSNMTVSTGWSMSAVNQEEATTTTGKKNQIILTNSTGVSIPADTHVKVIFFATNDNYITNPGSGAFFAKINDYSDFTAGTPPTLSASDIVDGGVTVANVMNESIAISTKVLETMDFSVGTVDPDTLSKAEYNTALGKTGVDHGQCNPVLNALNPSDPSNVLTLGDPNTQDQNSTKTNYALSTSTTYATHSYFRLSSNSTGGATVYYSGVTLSNTEGDKIAGIGNTATAPSTGTEQFGLALDNNDATPYKVSYTIPHTGDDTDWGVTDGTHVSDGTEYGVDTANLLSNYNDNTNPNENPLSPDWDAGSFANSSAHDPQLAPLVPYGDSGTGVNYYGGGTGLINGAVDTTFAFSPTANTIPQAIASESNKVVDCVTGKVRYIGNIAATTPAGVYTTKINYIAAPQY